MAREKLNCWDYQGCGRGPDASRPDKPITCPAGRATALDGCNGGTAGGRACWSIPGTMCEGAPRGTWEQKRTECTKCAFFRRVEVEEGLAYESAEDILSRTALL